MSSRRSGRWRALRLLPAAGAAWIAAAVAVCAPGAATGIAAALWGAAGIGVVAAFRANRRWLVVAIITICGAALAASHVALAQPARTSVHAAVGDGGRALVVTATIAGKVEARPSGDVWFDALADRIVVGERVVEGLVPIRIGADPDAARALEAADVGARIEVRGTSFPPGVAERAVLTMRVRSVEVVAEAGGVLRGASELRHALRTSAATLPEPGSVLVPGLAVGDTGAVGAELDAVMKASSLAHLTAVSGANCAIVVGLAFGVAAMCGAGRRLRIAAAVVALTGFVVLVTPEPSVVRAGAMALIAMLALALGRAGSGIAVLSLAITALLALDPWLAMSLGFALSASATASLLLLAAPLAEGLSRWMPRALALALSVPLAAQLACAPLLVIIDPRVPLLGVLANLLAAPAAPLATVVGLVACLASPVPWLQDGLTAIAWLPASWIAAVAGTVAALPAQQLPWWSDVLGVLALAAVCAAVALVIAVRPDGSVAGRASRSLALLVVAIVVGLAGGQAALRSVVGPLTVPSSWSIAVCDVGQGDAVLMRAAGQVALIDTGPDPAVLSACLDRFGLGRIDLVVLTHFDADHAGGVDAVVGRAGAVLHGPTDGVADERTLEELAQGGASLVRAAPGLRGSLGDAQWRVLWPEEGAAPGNDASVVLDVRGGGLPATLLLGDLSAEAQHALRRASPMSAFEVVKVAHHGSADQDAALYQATRPALALIPVGADNDYGHPRDSILSTLVAVGATIARSDQHGLIAVWKHDGMLHLWRERRVA